MCAGDEGVLNLGQGSGRGQDLEIAVGVRVEHEKVAVVGEVKLGEGGRQVVLVHIARVGHELLAIRRDAGFALDRRQQLRELGCARHVVELDVVAVDDAGEFVRHDRRCVRAWKTFIAKLSSDGVDATASWVSFEDALQALHAKGRGLLKVSILRLECFLLSSRLTQGMAQTGQHIHSVANNFHRRVHLTRWRDADADAAACASTSTTPNHICTSCSASAAGAAWEIQRGEPHATGADERALPRL